jgi:hypothetical protein
MRHSASYCVIIFATLVSLPACENKNDSPPAAERPTTPAATPETQGHAPAGATPGSHEDWCGEHQVPESQCTRCNPSLVAAFKATNDWCEGHGLPESQCFACNPDLKIERPPRAGEATP